MCTSVEMGDVFFIEMVIVVEMKQPVKPNGLLSGNLNTSKWFIFSQI